MPLLIPYLIKFSLGLSLVYLFYQAFLRRLTFYNWNRWYLILYPLFCLLLAFTNISPWLQERALDRESWIHLVPSVSGAASYLPESAGSGTGLSAWTIVLLVLAAGSLLLAVRLLIQYLSLRRLRRRSVLLVDGKVRIYEVQEPVAPFSFGQSIFIHQPQHTEEELREIIRHEFIHVRQRHSIDILLSEGICLLNWFNPFAWLLRHSLRQNLEFIADQAVLNNGVDRTRYQYLLLKVMGNAPFRIAPQFNFSSLKKRIAMMNKIKSARIHLVKFLFVLPLAAFMLLAFRGMQQKDPSVESRQILSQTAPVAQSGNPGGRQDCLNDKGYCISMADNQGVALVIVRDRQQKIVASIPYREWMEEQKKYEDLYGPIPAPPPPPAPPRHQGDVATIDIRGHRARVVLNNQKVEWYDLEKKAEKAAFEEKYGPLAPPPPPPPPQAPVPPRLPEGVRTIDINDNQATVRRKDGKIEKYDLSKPAEKSAFEKKYGPLPAPPREPLPVDGLPADGSAAPLPAREWPADPGKAPLLIVDGKQMPAGTDPKQVIQPEQIVSMEIWKGAEAREEYGEQGKNGVVVIRTEIKAAKDVKEAKQAKEAKPAKEAKEAKTVEEKTIRVTYTPASGGQDEKISITADTLVLQETAGPPFRGIYIINGKTYSADEFKALQLKPGQIAAMQVWKGKSALEKYGENGREGVIELTLKE